MFYMETVYLQMAAGRELAKERLRGHDEHDDLCAKAGSGHEDAPQQAGPYAGVSAKGPWRIERWRGAGW